MLPFSMVVDLVLFTIRYTYISLPVAVLSSSLRVSTFLCSCLSLFLSFFLSFCLIRLFGLFPPEPSLVWYLFPSFLSVFLFLFLFSCLLMCCSLFPLWTLFSGSCLYLLLQPATTESVSLRTKASVRNSVVLDGYQSRKIDLM